MAGCFRLVLLLKLALFMKPWTLLDKLLWRFMRWATQFVVRPLIFLKITPNQVTLFSAIINFSLATFSFAQGTYGWNIAGLFFLLLHSYFDFADGTLARAVGKSSKVGGWLDSKLDIVGAEAVTVGIVIGTIRSHPTPFWLLIAAGALLGRLGILSIVFDYANSVYKNWQFLDSFRADKKMTLADKIIKEFLTLESFPFLFIGTFRYFLPIMVLLNKLHWFVVIFALFNNIRWVIMFWAYAKAFGGDKTNIRVIKLLAKYLE